MFQEPLHRVPKEGWPELQSVFLSNGPRSFLGYSILEAQTRLMEKGFDYGFQVYCPFGDAENGFVAINEKASFYEILIHYPKDDTKTLEEALRTTKIINWERQIILPFTAYHIIACVENIKDEKNIEMSLLPSDTFILESNSPLFEDISLPPGITFDLLNSEHVDFIDSKWPHRYPTSTWFFQLLIETESGYGLYKDGKLISWALIAEFGHLCHLYTLEEYRSQGYAELILKLISNEILKKKIHVLVFSVKGNTKAFKLYKKLGFKEIVDVQVTWCYLTKKNAITEMPTYYSSP